MFLAVIVGIITSSLSLAFNFGLYHLIQGVTYLRLTYNLEYYLLPLFGGVILGIMNKYVITKNRSFDIIAIEEEIDKIDINLLKFKDVLLKVFASIVSLISGYSLGRLGTIVYLGGFIGSYCGYNINKNKEYVMPLIGCGVSGMIAGIFGSPLLAVFFVNEILIKKRSQEILLLSALSALTSYLFTDIIYKQGFILNQISQSYHLIEFNLYFLVLLALLIGIVGLFFIFNINAFSKKILSKAPFLVSVLAGVILFIMGLKIPIIFTVYQDTMNQLQVMTSTSYLILFVFIKSIATSLSYRFGGYGGLFLPIVMIGMALGRLFYQLTGYGHSGVLMVLSISGLFSCLTGGPLTGIILGFVLSGYEWAMLPMIILINLITYYMIKKSPFNFIY